MTGFPIMRVTRMGVGYFVHVFIAGFLLGVIRTLWVEPYAGAVMAELMEAPVMLLVIYTLANLRVKRSTTVSASQWLAVGGIALALLLITELAVAAWLRGLTPAQYIAGRDALAGGVYVALLVAFALMPWFLRHRVA